MRTSPVLVIFPVHNEARNLNSMLPPLLEVVRREQYDLMAIDDASTDESLEILKRYGISALALRENLGYGAAIQTGYKYAEGKGYDYLIQVDGDGQHDPRFLPIIHRELADYDFVIGSRFLEHENTGFPPMDKLYKGTKPRKAGIVLFRFLLYVMTGAWISDPTSGYIGMNAKCMRFLTGDRYPYDFPDADLRLLLLRNRFKIYEAPVYMYGNDSTGWLHRGIRPAWYVFKMMLSLFVCRIRKIENR